MAASPRRKSGDEADGVAADRAVSELEAAGREQGVRTPAGGAAGLEGRLGPVDARRVPSAALRVRAFER